MAQFTKGLDLYRHQMQRFQRVGATIREMHKDLANEGFADAIELTSGRVSKAELRRAGHPFGRGASAAVSEPGALKRGGPKGARAKYPNLPINRQTGRLQAGFRLTREPGGVQAFGIRNRAHYARFILSPTGTKKMAGRGYGGMVGQGAPKTGETVRRFRARTKAFVETIKKSMRQF